jgi:hypothetical protein
MKEKLPKGALLVFLVCCALLAGRGIGYNGSYAAHGGAHAQAHSVRVSVSLGAAEPQRMKELPERQALVPDGTEKTSWGPAEVHTVIVPVANDQVPCGCSEVLRE